MPNPNKKLEDVIASPYSCTEAIKKFLQDLSIDIDDISENDLNRYQLAFTHGSATKEENNSYERLEWLGDRVLNLIAAGYLYDTYEESAEGDLSKKLECVSNDNLQKVIEEDALIPDTLIQTGKGTPVTPHIRADVFEALVGAIYLHLGFNGAKDVILPLFAKQIECFNPKENYKGRLQEECQSRYLPLPKYEEDKHEGPDDAPTFYYSVKIGDEIMGKGKGSRIILAEQEAAKMALEEMEKITNIE